MARFNYRTMTDLELEDNLFKCGITAPKNEQNRIIRRHALALLKAWEDANPEELPIRKMRVVFHKPGHENATTYVAFGFNGVAYQAPYDKEIVLPENVIRECIDRARLVQYSQQPDEHGNVRLVSEFIQVHPYTMLGYVDEQAAETPVDEFTLAIMEAEEAELPSRIAAKTLTKV